MRTTFNVDLALELNEKAVKTLTPPLFFSLIAFFACRYFFREGSWWAFGIAILFFIQWMARSILARVLNDFRKDDERWLANAKKEEGVKRPVPPDESPGS